MQESPYARRVARTWVRSRSLERIADLGRRSLDTKALRVELLEVLRDAVGFDAYVWLLTDPVTTVGAAPLVDVRGVVHHDLPALIRAKYGSEVNRWTTLLREGSPVALLDTAVVGEPHAAGTWLRTLTGLGTRGVASCVFADQFGCWGFLDLWRRELPFDEPEEERLRALAPAVTQVLREAQARTFIEPATSHRHDGGPAALTLDEDLRITSRTAASQAWLDLLLPPEPGALAVAASVYNVAAQLLALESGIDDHPASTRTHLADGFWLTLRAARTAPVEQQDDRRGPMAVMIVTIEEASAAERLELFGRALALTAREFELLGLLAAGGDTRSIARSMRVSEHTVQDHLKGIFAKTGSRDRVSVLARALGTARVQKRRPTGRTG